VLILVTALGLLIGLVIGALGGGGGVLTVPVFVYLLGQNAQDATTSSVVIVGITAVVGAMTRARGGLVRWRTGLAFGAVGIPAALLGTVANRHADEHVLLLAFAGLTLLVAAAMLLDGRSARTAPAAEPRAGGGVAVLTRTVAPARATAVKVVACGIAVGFLTGFLGVGGGFLVVPALVIVLRMPMSLAIGTSLMIIGLNAAASVASRVAVAEFDWAVIVPFTLAAVAGTLAGKRVADRCSGPTLTRAFALMLVLVGGFVAVQSLAAF
jgi:Predicted permeases